jgi:hypothetical protein
MVSFKEQLMRFHVGAAKDMHKEAKKVRRRRGNIMIYEIFVERRKFHLQAARLVKEA